MNFGFWLRHCGIALCRACSRERMVELEGWLVLGGFRILGRMDKSARRFYISILPVGFLSSALKARIELPSCSLCGAHVEGSETARNGHRDSLGLGDRLLVGDRPRRTLSRAEGRESR